MLTVAVLWAEDPLGDRLAGSRWLVFEASMIILAVAMPYALRSAGHARIEIGEALGRMSAEAVSQGLAMSPRLEQAGQALAGALLALFALLTVYLLPVPWVDAKRYLFLAWVVLVPFGYGCLAWRYLVFLHGLVIIGRAEVESGMLSWPRHEVAAIYSVYTRLLVLGSLVYLTAAVSIWSTPGEWVRNPVRPEFVELKESHWHFWLVEGFWIYSPGLMVLLFFAGTQVSCSNLLRQCRGNVVIVRYSESTTSRRKPGKASSAASRSWRNSRIFLSSEQS